MGAIETADSFLKAKMGCSHTNDRPSFIFEIENYSNQNLIIKSIRKKCATTMTVAPSTVIAGTVEAFSAESNVGLTGTCGLVVWEIASEDQKQMLAVYWDMPADFQIHTYRNTLGFGVFDSGNVDNLFDDFAGGKGLTSAYVTKYFYPEKANPLIFTDGDWYIRGAMTTAHNGRIKVLGSHLGPAYVH